MRLFSTDVFNPVLLVSKRGDACLKHLKQFIRNNTEKHIVWESMIECANIEDSYFMHFICVVLLADS